MISNDISNKISQLRTQLALKTDLPSRLRKLGEEVGELAEAVANGGIDQIGEEGADVIIVAWDILELAGFSPLGAVISKLDAKLRAIKEGA